MTQYGKSIITLRVGSTSKHEMLKAAAARAHKSLNQYCNEAIDVFGMLDDIRAEEGAVIELICDNPDFNGLPDSAIYIKAGWTAWAAERFTGSTFLEALTNAYKEMVARNEIVLDRNVIGISVEDMRLIIAERNRDARAGGKGIEGVSGTDGGTGSTATPSEENKEAAGGCTTPERSDIGKGEDYSSL